MYLISIMINLSFDANLSLLSLKYILDLFDTILSNKLLKRDNHVFIKHKYFLLFFQLIYRINDSYIFFSPRRFRVKFDETFSSRLCM